MLGLVVGAVLLVRRELYGIFPNAHLATAHAHAVWVGFVMFLILGVALWLFPRAPGGGPRGTPPPGAGAVGGRGAETPGRVGAGWGALPAGSLASATGGLVLDTIKRAEDGDALVLRLYEPHGGRGTARIRVPATSAFRANILEDRGEELEIEGGEIIVPYEPWQIVTVYASSSSE